MSGFELGQFEWKKNAESGIDFAIKSPIDGKPLVDGAGNPVTIKACGAESSRIKAAVRERIKRRQAEEKAAGGADPAETLEQREADMIDDLCTVTLGWSDNWILDGQPFKYSPDNARTLYTRFPEIAEQMVANVSARLNFMPSLSKT